MFRHVFDRLKRYCGFVSLLLFIQLASAQAGQAIPQPEIKKINDKIYAFLGPIGFPSRENHGYMVNSAVLIGNKGVILIDTGFSDAIGQHLKQAIAGITDKPVTHIINTHHHGDHILGNSAFPDAEIISSEKCRELVEKLGYEWIGRLENMTGETYPNTRPVPADTVYPQQSRNTVTLDGVTMEFWAPAGSHTPGDMMVYLPGDRVLISGDILVKEMIPSFVDAHVGSWIDTLAQIQKVDIKTVIPGHGPLMTPTEVTQMHERMAKLYAGVEEGYLKGKMDSEIRKSLDLSEWRKMKEFDGLMGININRTYLEVERENF